MIQVAFDWNCIIDLEEDHPVAPILRQIQTWYDLGKIALCISSTIRLENPQNHDALVIDESEWASKLHSVGLGAIELRSSSPRAFLAPDGSNLFDDSLEQLVMREIHTILFPNIDFSYYDYCRRMNVEPYTPRGFINLSEAHRAANGERRRVTKKWNNAKCDALSLYAYSTWAGPDDLFVTSDKNFHEKKEQLLQPFRMQRRVLAPLPGYVGTFQEAVELTEQVQTVVISGAICGHIMTPREAVEYLWMQLGGEDSQ